VNESPRFLLRIPHLLYEKMLAQAAAELPNECCGLLAGRLGGNGTSAQVTQLYALVNERASPSEFVSEPKSMFTAMKAMRQEAIEVLAVYHSHPTSEPIPSKRDQEMSYSSTVMNLIIGLANEKPEVCGWWLLENEYFAGSLEVTNSPQSEISNPK
jgi:[CysO sulfur-carrier protein]-S-L-cysteine hydrolase